MPTKLEIIFNLIKAGYKAGEINDLLAEDANVQHEDPGAEKHAEIPPKEERPPEREKADEKPGSERQTEPEDKITIEQLQGQVEDLTKKLSEAQAANTKKDNSGTHQEDPQETLNEIMKRFM